MLQDGQLVAAAEEERFSRTMSAGADRVGEAISDLRRSGGEAIPGPAVFRFYDTFGIPLELIEELSECVAEASLCALGGTAPNPVLSTLRYFRDEYKEHILNKRCPAKVCRAFLKYRILSDVCSMCGRCAKACPAEAITGKVKKKKEKGIPFAIDEAKCIKCGMCFESCKFEAVEVQ